MAAINLPPIFEFDSATLPSPKPFMPPHREAPTIFRGCGLRFPEASAEHATARCVDIVGALRPLRSLRVLVSRLLPTDHRASLGVHLRAPDSDLDIGGRRLSQGRAACHPTALYVGLVAEEYLRSPRVSLVYVASGSTKHLADFSAELLARLGPHETELQGAGRRMPRVVSLADLLAMNGAPVNKPRPASEGPWASGGRDTVFGVRGAVLDLWALASTSKVFRTGESTFGMLASALHRKPSDVVVINASEPSCRAWSQMFAKNGTPAFCAPNRGAEEPRACLCA